MPPIFSGLSYVKIYTNEYFLGAGIGVYTELYHSCIRYDRKVFVNCNGGYLLTTIISQFKFSSKDNRGRCETQDVKTSLVLVTNVFDVIHQQSSTGTKVEVKIK